MIIDTKFNIGDICWVMYSNLPTQLYVKQIKIEKGMIILPPKMNLNKIILFLDNNNSTSLKNKEHWLEVDLTKCFKTKRKLITSL
jgi:hypothetical protein